MSSRSGRQLNYRIMNIYYKNHEKDIKDILENPEIECISIVDPNILSANIENFQKILSIYKFRSAIHYVMKVNRSIALLRKA
jgi:hypothetical protein